MNNQQQQHNQKHDAGISDVLGSMMGLAQASTRFTWRQMQNAMGLCVGSQKALNNVRDSMENICNAMSTNGSSSHGGTTADTHNTTEPQSAQEAFTGRKV